MPKCIFAEHGSSSGGSLTLLSIAVTTAPTKTSYLSGETFNSSGMVVTASYGINSVVVAEAPVTGYAVSPSTLTDGVTSVTITYTEMGQTCTCTQAVTVTHKLTKIAVTTSPTTTTYEYGGTLSTSGMVVTATYSDSKTATVTGYSCNPTSLTTVGTQTITVSYAENGVTCTTTFSVTVNRMSVTKPTWKSNLTYSGSAQTVTSTSYWNNYNTTYMTIGGTTSSTNAGTYTATFTLGSNYRWADGTTSVLSVSWTINKTTGSLSLSTTSVAIDASNLTKTVTITRSGDGAISYSPTSVTGLTLSLSGTTLTIKGNGSTAVSTTITISVAAGTNYTAPSSKTITVTATYWEWGDETAVGDAAWWAGLKSYAASATATQRSALVGKTKRMSLSTSVLGSSHFLMRCVGYDKDGTGTLAFNSVYSTVNTTTFGSSAVWIESSARSYCQQIYEYCSAKDSIRTVSKGTCATISTGSSRNDTVTYNDETVFLLSEREYGLDTYSPKSTANSTTTGAECTYGYNAAYDYFTENSTRVMYRASDAAATTASSNYACPWERSRGYYNDSYTVCFVNYSGTANWGYYDYGRGLAPAFVI